MRSGTSQARNPGYQEIRLLERFPKECLHSSDKQICQFITKTTVQRRKWFRGNNFVVQRSIHRFNWRESYEIFSKENSQTLEHREENQNQNFLQDNKSKRFCVVQRQSPVVEQIGGSLRSVLSRLWWELHRKDGENGKRKINRACMVWHWESDAKPPKNLSSLQPYVWDTDDVWRYTNWRRTDETP